MYNDIQVMYTDIPAVYNYIAVTYTDMKSMQH